MIVIASLTDSGSNSDPISTSAAATAKVLVRLIAATVGIGSVRITALVCMTPSSLTDCISVGFRTR
jgi:hypothetical protein